MKTGIIAVFAAGLFLFSSDASTGRPSYWKKTPSEKIIDKVYEAYGKSGARQRRLWDDMNKSRGRRVGPKHGGRTLRDGREWVPRDRCVKLSFAGMKPSRLSQSELRSLLKYDPIRRSWRGWTNWSQWRMVKRLRHYLANCPIRPKESGVLAGILAGKYAKSRRPSKRSSIHWSKRPYWIADARRKRERAAQKRAYLRRQAELETIAAMRKRHKNGYRPPAASLCPVPTPPPKARIPYEQRDLVQPVPIPGLKLATKFFGKSIVQHTFTRNGRQAFRRVAYFYPFKKGAPRTLNQVSDYFYCDSPLTKPNCYRHIWYYDIGKRRGPFGDLFLKPRK